MERVVESALKTGAADGAYVERVLFSEQQVEVVASRGFGVPDVGTRVAYPGSLTEEVIDTGAPAYVDNVADAEESIARILEGRCGECGALVLPVSYTHLTLPTN